MNSKNSKFPHPHKFLLNLTNKIDLGRDEKKATLSNLSITHMEKHKKVT